jgi:hypothetical protein
MSEETATIVDVLYQEFHDVVAFLDGRGEISYRVTAEENFRKALLIAAASYFEHNLCAHIVDFVHEVSSNNERVIEFVKNKAIHRQYHTFFDWDDPSPNANRFFRFFGESFKIFMKSEAVKGSSLHNAIEAFIELGQDRNRLVHEDFGTFYLEKTAEEIYDLYKIAKPFVDSLPEKLRSKI